MTPGGRILLLDALDSTGSDFGDARDRAALLRAAGTRVTALVMGRDLDPAAKGMGRDSLVAEPGAPALRAVRALAASAHFDLAVMASAEPHGGSVARALPPGLPVLWWSTGFAVSSAVTWLGRLARSLGARELPSLLGSNEDASESMVPSLAGSFVEPPGSRRATLPLWDGDIVLVSEGLDEPHGAIALAAFASLAEEWSELDLVTWSHPRPADEALAQRLGTGARVHQVGPAPRMAEWAWWSQARAVLVSGSAPISGGRILRALASGCPILFVGETETLGSLPREMLERGYARHATADARVVAAELFRLLEHGPEVDAVIERGRIVAARHDRSTLAARLAAGLSLATRGDAAAA